MEPAQRVKAASDMKVSVRTVADVEVGPIATPTSPPATEKDRAEFQKLLWQMNGATNDSNKAAGGNVSTSGVKSLQKDLDTSEKMGVTTLSSQSNQDKKKKKKRGKKSNKPSPTDSPLKTANPKDGAKPLVENEADNEVATKALPLDNPSQKKLTTADKPSQGKAVKAVKKELQNLSEAKRLPQNANNLGGTAKPHVGGHLEYAETHEKETVVKQILKDVKNVNAKEIRGSTSGPSGASSTGQEREDVSSLNPFQKQPLMLLKAAMNLIQPKKKIVTSKDLNLFLCIPCDKEFSDLDRHLEKTRDIHAFNWKCEMKRRTIDLLPALSRTHISLLDDLVTSTVEKFKFPNEQYEIAQALWESLDTLARTKFDCSVRWFGSHASRIALSDNTSLNMDLLVPNKEDAAITFLHFISAIEENFTDVERVVSTNFAHAIISHRGMSVQLSLNNNGAYATSKLINDYISVDDRVQPLCIFYRYWGKLCAVDQGENGSWQGHAFPIMVIHFLQQREVLPVLHDMVPNPDGNPEVYLEAKHLQGCWKSGQNTDSVGRLLYEMFRYYAVGHDVEKHVVSITQFKPFLRQDTKWNAKRIAVIDPFQPKHNISRYISAHMYDYVHFCLLTTTCLLGIPRSEAGPLFGFICPRPERSIFEQTPSVLEDYLAVSEYIYELVLKSDSNYSGPDLQIEEDKIESLKSKLLNSPVYRDLCNVLRVMPACPHQGLPTKNAYARWWVTPYQGKCLPERFHPEALRLPFSKELCTDNEIPPITCTSCHKSGHLRAKCPDEMIPKMNPLPPPSKELNDILHQLCLEIFESRRTEEREIHERMEIRNDLLLFLKQFYKDIDLSLFGSSLNGFGGRSSDIDMCLTFHSNATGEGMNFPNIVEEIQHRLKGHRSIYQLVAITTAKVPIVKFLYGRAAIQVDISLYNRLGIMNTQLLHAYSVIDLRVRPLVYMMKCLAKATGIGDASRGSLSSYAYSLMTLYFLQQVEPPIIPVLQELHEPNVGPRVETVDGANVYFFKNHERLDEVWPYRNKNKSTLGELWLQLLEFYASEKFHYSQKVVCIRKKAPLFKFDKLWTSTNICIEDPFDLNHNLGSGLSKRMNIFIVKTLQRACKHFSALPKPDRVASLEKWYFNENTLSIGKPPSDRGCHFCRSIGHVQNDCPQRQRVQMRGMMQNRPRPNANHANRNNGRPNHHQGFENPFNRGGGGGGNRRDQMPRHREYRDPGRISNMPMPMPMMPVPMAMPNQQSAAKTMNIQNHVVVGSMKPPGFPALPPGYSPVRLVAPQVQMQQMYQNPNPNFVLNRPSHQVRPGFPWQ